MKRWIGAGAVCVVFCMTASLAESATPMRYSRTTTRADAQIIDNLSTFDANNLEMFVTNIGSFAYDKTASRGRNDGLYFPKGTNTTSIYAAGLWMGGLVNGAIRVASAEYSGDFTPGPMVNGQAQADRGSYRVYKISTGDTRDNNPDYRDWPFDDGAPFVRDGNGDPVRDDNNNMIPLILGDQALWCVYNDANFANHESDPGLGSAGPLGVEVQLYVWGYARAGALGNSAFMQFTVINKGSNTINDMYMSLWADPDLGSASDDFVGCDTIRSLGYCWNDGEDGVYTGAPPAVGFDFFSGPIEPAGGDTTAFVFRTGQCQEIPGYKNLPMTSFNKYINGTDPSNNSESYNYMQGLDRDGSDIIDPITGTKTNFFHSGDPVTGEGWLDNNSADRRYMMSSGPFVMEPGDTQEVVAAVLVGQGLNERASVDALKRVDDIAQNVFDLCFDIPGPPPLPSMWAVPHDEAVQLLWGTEADGDVQEGLGPPDPETGEQEVIQRFAHEGFNLWQGQSMSGPWTKLATYDVINDVERIYNDVDNPEGKERVVVQRGTNSGLIHDLWVTQDRIKGGGLVNNRPYWFALTAYNYDELNQQPFEIGPNTFGIIAESFENLQNGVEVTPRSMTGILADTADHVAGISGGMVLIDIPNPGLVTGDSYEVNFNEDASWNLVNTSMGTTELSNEAGPISSSAVDGMVIRVLGPPSGIDQIVEVANADGPVDPPDNVKYSLNSTGDWYVSSDQTSNFDRLNWQGLIGIDDWEIRFTAEGSEYYDFNTDTKWGNRAPFEIWNLGPGTLDDESDDRQLQFTILDDDESGGWSMGDRIYVIELDYSEPLPEDFDFDGNFPQEFHIGRIVINDNSGAGPAPEGTVIRFTTFKPNQMGDVFTFETMLPDATDGTAIPLAVEGVHPVPNPYYNTSSLEIDQFNRVIKFVNLPAAKVTVRIFNLAGDLVRTLVRSEVTEGEMIWDTLTESGIPVASGLYIYHVDAEGIGTKVGKMAVFTEVEQLDNF